MPKLTVHLPADLQLALERTAAAQGKSKAEIVRGAIAAATAEPDYPRVRIPLFDSGDATLADNIAKVLAGGFGD